MGVAIMLLGIWNPSLADDYSSVEDTCARFEVSRESRHDFGDIGQADGPVKCAFAIKSVGGMPLIVLSTVTTCPCTQATVDKDVVIPGDSVNVIVTYNPHSDPGPFEQAIILKTNAEPYNFIRLYVCGNIVAGSLKRQGHNQRDLQQKQSAKKTRAKKNKNM